MENLVNKDFWKGKKVFITGHTGFVGTWLSVWLKKLGTIVYGYSLDAQKPSMFDAIKMIDKIDVSFVGDIRRHDDLNFRIHEVEPEIIIHLAAQSLVKKSYNLPVTTFETNIMGIVNLLDSIKNCSSVKAILNVTTDKVYFPSSSSHYEADKLGGKDPYSCSKACSELVTQAYFNSFLKDLYIGVGTARSGNIIGGGDWGKDRLIPDMIRSIFNEWDKTIVLRNPKSVRPWTYILDTLSGYLKFVEHLYSNLDKMKSYNFGPLFKDKITVEDLTQIFLKLWNDPALSYKIEIDETKSEKETDILKLDCSSVFYDLKWKQKIDIYNSVQLTIDWYKELFMNGNQDMYDFTLKQIESYENI